VLLNAGFGIDKYSLHFVTLTRLYSIIQARNHLCESTDDTLDFGSSALPCTSEHGFPIMSSPALPAPSNTSRKTAWATAELGRASPFGGGLEDVRVQHDALRR
jgi:hypothetical protein